MLPLLEDLRAEQSDLAGLVKTVDLESPTPAQGWTVRDTVAHLAGTDVEAARAAAHPQEFLAGLGVVAANIEGFLTGQLLARRELTRDQLMADWQGGFDQLLVALGELPEGAKVPWYGPPMSPASFATARLMEYWAHGQDVADAAGATRIPTARLRHIVHLGVRTRGFAQVNRGLEPDLTPVVVKLTAPDGTIWQHGDLDAEQQVSGPAVDFCLLVTQRRHRSDLRLRADGAAADAWLDVAQCFAGPPGPGRAATAERS